MLGEWFLHHISIDGEIESYQGIYYPYNLIFSETDFNGSLCNAYWSNYNYDENIQTLSILALYQTFGSCAGSGGASEDYESGLFYNILWTNGGNPTTLDYDIIGTGTNQTLTLTNENGNYAVYGRQLLGINTFENQPKISAYPNPVHDILNINSNDKILKYTVYDLNGRLVNNLQTIASNKIDVSKLNPGIYFLELMYESHKTQTLKFIKL